MSAKECAYAAPMVTNIPEGGHDPLSSAPPGPGGRRRVFAGITKRAYFAARAPHQVPEWFHAKMTWECPAVPSYNAVPDGALRLDLLRHYQNDCEPVTPAGQAWVAAREAAINEQSRWQQEFREQCIAQWPWYWADMVLKAGAA